jgi:hypothetical protein
MVQDSETKAVNEVFGTQGSEEVIVGLLGCNAMWTCRQLLLFWRNAGIHLYKSTQHYNPED